MKNLLLISLAILFLPSILSQASFPDLGVHVDSFNCQNAQEFLALAHSDTERIEKTLHTVQNKISLLEDIKQLILEDCEQPNKADASSLLQTEDKTASHQDHASKVQNMLILLKQQADDNESIEQILSDSEKQSFKALDEACSSETSFARKCGELTKKADNLLIYLKSLSEFITNTYLNDFLSKRIETIKQELENCEIITQSGELKISFWGQNHVFNSDVPEARHQDYNIVFDKPFPEIPSVGVAIRGFDIQDNLLGLAASVVSATDTGATIRVYVLPNVRVFYLELSYIATVSSRSGIMMQTNLIDYTSDKDIEVDSQSSGSYFHSLLPRQFSRKLKLPTRMYSAEAAAFISGISLGKSTNPHFSVEVTEVTSHDLTLTYSVWDDTVLYSAMTTVLVYDKSMKSTALTQKSNVQDRLYEGSGPRKEFYHILLGEYWQKPALFYALYLINLVSEQNYRLLQYHDLSGSSDRYLQLTFSVWGDSKIVEIGDKVFATCPSKKCLSVI